MDDATKSLVEEYRRLPSAAAADLLLERHPRLTASVAAIFSGRSWKKADQYRLADHYLRGMPFATDKPYRIFAEKLPLTAFLKIVRTHIPEDDSGRSLAIYFLTHTLMSMTTTQNSEQKISAFLAELNRPSPTSLH